MFICGTCHGRHEFVSQARACLEAQNRPAHTPVSPPENRPTEPQLKYIGDLGGDVAYARTLTRREASAYISTIKERKSHVNVPPNRNTTKIPMQMLKDIQPGYYAVQKDDEPHRFYRVSQPKTGKFKGTLKIQSQHGENYQPVMVLYPSDKLYWYNVSAEDDLLIIAVNQRSCALEYGQKIGRCCRCNKDLTDDRSRYFGIGPECEKHWPHMITMVEDTMGEYQGA